MDDLLKRYEQAQEAMGSCSDGHCVVKRQRGMHTNGGCRCLYHPDHLTAQRAGHILRLAQEMATRIRELEAVVAEYEVAEALSDELHAPLTWQSLETSRPDDEEEVLLYFPDQLGRPWQCSDDGYVVGFWGGIPDDSGWYQSECSSNKLNELLEPTHWARIPKPEVNDG